MKLRQESPKSPGQIRRHLADRLAQFEALDLADKVADVRAAFDHAEGLWNARTSKQDVRALEQRVGARLAAGEVTIEDAVAELTRVQLLNDEAGSAQRVLAQAAGAAMRSAWRLLDEPTDWWVEAVLRPKAEEITAAFAAEMAKLPDGVADDASAIAAGGKAAASWSRLCDLEAQFSNLHVLAYRLRGDSVLGAADWVHDDGTSLGSDLYRYRYPRRLPALSAGAHRVVRFAAAIRARCEPTLLTAPEVDDRERALDIEEAERRAAVDTNRRRLAGTW